jgi:hypothetical protein
MTLPKILFNKKHYQRSLCLALFGAVGALLFLGKLAVSEYKLGVVFSNDDWIGLGASLFIFTLFLPLSTTFYLSHEIAKHIKNTTGSNRQSDQEKE